MEAGATVALPDDRESSLRLSSSLLEQLGVSSDTVNSLSSEIRRNLELQDSNVLKEVAARRRKVNSGKLYTDSVEGEVVNHFLLLKVTNQFDKKCVRCDRCVQ